VRGLSGSNCPHGLQLKYTTEKDNLYLNSKTTIQQDRVQVPLQTRTHKVKEKMEMISFLKRSWNCLSRISKSLVSQSRNRKSLLVKNTQISKA